MADEDLLQKVHGLSDLELAQLLCLISREHALISTPPEALDDLVEELQLISTKVFGLTCVTVECTPHTTLEDFATSIQISPSPPSRSASPLRARNDSYLTPQPHAHAGRLAPLSPLTSLSSPGGSALPSTSRIANVVVAKNLDRAPLPVQIQALELLRTRRIFTRTAVQPAPKRFLLLAALAAPSGGRARVAPHLNDFLSLAHWHDPADGLPNLDEAWRAADGAETASTESVVKKSTAGDAGHAAPGEDEPALSEDEVAELARRARRATVDVDVLQYQANVVAFLRMHRAVAGGAGPAATRHLELLVRCLAPLHGLDYATPALVALAARKVYLHRIRIAEPGRERSMQWGSKVEAVRVLLDGIEPEDVIEDVLGMVTVPV